MRKLVYYVGVSLDGYIAGPDGDWSFFEVGDDLMAWIARCYPETIPTHGRPHIGMATDEPNRRFDTLIMGRATYEPALQIGVTSPYAHMRQYVASTTLDPVDDPAVTVVSDLAGTVRALKEEDGMDIWLCGGGRLAGTLLDQVDELILKHYPVVAGTGVPLFGGGFRPTTFTPTQREDFTNGTHVSWHARDAASAPHNDG